LLCQAPSTFNFTTLAPSEAAFSEKDLPRARQRRHLTAHQAGLLAKEAGAERLVIFHFSPRYHGQLNLLYDEASLAFGKEVSWRK